MNGTYLLLGCGFGITAAIVFILRVLLRWDLTAIFLVSIPAGFILGPAAMFAVTTIVPRAGGEAGIGFFLVVLAFFIGGCRIVGVHFDGIYSQVQDGQRPYSRPKAISNDNPVNLSDKHGG